VGERSGVVLEVSQTGLCAFRWAVIAATPAKTVSPQRPENWTARPTLAQFLLSPRSIELFISFRNSIFVYSSFSINVLSTGKSFHSSPRTHSAFRWQNVDSEFALLLSENCLLTDTTPMTIKAHMPFRTQPRGFFAVDEPFLLPAVEFCDVGGG